MPGDSGVTVVTMLVCFLFCTRGCGRIERPAFPAPSDFSGAGFQSKTRRPAWREHEALSENRATSLRGAKRRSNPFFSLANKLDCFAEPVVGRAFATRWLAMTFGVAAV